MATRVAAAPGSYVFLKPRGKKETKAKKVLIPNSLIAFKKSAAAAMGESRPIASFMTENGKIVTNIREVSPNSTLFVVYERSTGETSALNLPSMEIQEKRTGNITLQVSQPAIKATNSITQIAATPESKQGRIPSQKSTPTLSVSTRKSPNTLSITSSAKTSQITTPVSVKRPQPSLQDESTDYDDYDEDDKDAKSQVSQPHVEEEEDNSESYSSGSEHEYTEDESDEEVANVMSTKMFSTVIPCKDFRKDVVKAFSELNQDSQEFLNEAFALEESHQERYVNSILKVARDASMLTEPEKVESMREMRERARSIINNHRRIGTSGVTYSFKAAIVGPPKSGRSTFMTVFLRELLTDLVATDSWKSTFVLPLDMSQIMDQDPNAIFNNWVPYIFAQLRAQLPSMLEYLPCIERAFLGLMETKGTAVLPKKISSVIEHRRLAAELQGILSNMAAIWYDSSALLPWWTSIAMLPAMLSRAFGFKNVIYLCDHFDETAMEIHPSYPFEGSPHVAFLSEIWKCGVSHGSYILGARNTLEFTRILDSLDDFYYDVSHYVVFYNLYNLVKRTKYDDQEIVVEFSETNELLKIHSCICAGVPHYIMQWCEVNQHFDELDQLDSKTPEYEEKLCHAMTCVENLISTLYLPSIDDDEEEPATRDPLASLSVVDVRRRPISK